MFFPAPEVSFAPVHADVRPDPEHSVEFLTATGGTGESHEDNRDMVGVA